MSRCAASTKCGRGARAGPLAEHVPDLVDAHVLQAELAELARVELGPLRLLERRRLDLADLDLFGQGPGFVGLGGGQGRLDRAVLHQLGAELGRRLLGGDGCGKGDERTTAAAVDAHGDGILPAPTPVR